MLQTDAPDTGKHKEPKDVNRNDLSDSEKDLVRRLEKRDQEVRRHEQAHLSSAGGYAKGGARYDYQRGPDGKNYAVGGEVTLDVSKIPNDPEATIAKMEIVKKAALAPAEPSSKDRTIARNASRAIQKARTELRTKGQEHTTRPSNSGEAFNPYSLRTTANIADPIISMLA